MPTHRTTHKLSRPPGDHMASRRARSKFASLNIRFALVLPTVACGARHSGAVGVAEVGSSHRTHRTTRQADSVGLGHVLGACWV